MFAAPILTTDSEGPEATAWARPLHVRDIDMLGRLAEQGFEIASDIARLSKAAESVEAAQGCAMAHARISRAIRLTLMLRAKLIQDLQAFDRNEVYHARTAVEHRKDRVQRVVERVIDTEAASPDAAERLVEDLAERLDDDDVYGDVMSRPVSELVAMICKDLGLDPDWPALAQEAWARKEVAGGSPGWPLTAEASGLDSVPPPTGEDVEFETPFDRPSPPPDLVQDSPAFHPT
jgi:hypothetical protein